MPTGWQCLRVAEHAVALCDSSTCLKVLGIGGGNFVRLLVMQNLARLYDNYHLRCTCNKG